MYAYFNIIIEMGQKIKFTITYIISKNIFILRTSVHFTFATHALTVIVLSTAVISPLNLAFFVIK